jgi:hypothetical protein
MRPFFFCLEPANLSSFYKLKNRDSFAPTILACFDVSPSFGGVCEYLKKEFFSLKPEGELS